MSGAKTAADTTTAMNSAPTSAKRLLLNSRQTRLRRLVDEGSYCPATASGLDAAPMEASLLRVVDIRAISVQSDPVLAVIATWGHSLIISRTGSVDRCRRAADR
jgi:hypothetical protein